MSEPDFDIDSASAAFDAARQGEAEPTSKQSSQSVLPPEDGDGDALPADPALDPDQIEVTELDDPPGFKPYDEYIADGGDPDMYRGKAAYVAEHARIEDNKQLRKEVKELNGMVRTTVEAVDTWQTRETDRIRSEVTEELNEAKASEDVDAALAAQKKLDDLDEQQQTTTVTPQEHPVIAAFREENPLLDPSSEQFNAEFNADMQGMYNSLVSQLTNNNQTKLTEGQMGRALKKAMKEARELNEELFESPRNTRRTPGQEGTPKRRPTERQPAPRAENYVIEDPRNPQQRNAATDVRETIRKEAVKAAKKAGKSEEDAAKAGDAAAARFEKSLMS